MYQDFRQLHDQHTAQTQKRHNAIHMHTHNLMRVDEGKKRLKSSRDINVGMYRSGKGGRRACYVTPGSELRVGRREENKMGEDNEWDEQKKNKKKEHATDILSNSKTTAVRQRIRSELSLCELGVMLRSRVICGGFMRTRAGYTAVRI